MVVFCRVIILYYQQILQAFVRLADYYESRTDYLMGRIGNPFPFHA